jgi:KRAB domain-containing zinc finger protein
MKVHEKKCELNPERKIMNKKPHICQFCDKKFTVQIIMKLHENKCELNPERKIINKKPYICQFCNVKFTVQSNMKVHEKKCGLNPERKIMNKSVKNYTIEHQQKLKNKELIHKNNLPNSCNAIKKNSGDPELGKSKMPNLSEDLFSCKLCSGTFRNKSHLKKHKGVHKGGKKGVINKKFTHKTILKLAEAKENLKSNKLTIENDLPNSSEKLSCEFCSGTFRYGSHLRTHERIHTGYLMTKCLFLTHY